MENIFIENADGQMEINFHALESYLGESGERFVTYLNQQILEGWEIVRFDSISHYSVNVWIKDGSNLIQHIKYKKYEYAETGFSYQYYNGYDLLILLNAIGGTEKYDGKSVQNFDWRKEV